MHGPKSSPVIEPPQPAVPVSGVPGGAALVEPEMHVLDRLHVLYKYRKAMISVTSLVVVAGILQTYTTTPAYRSQAQVRVEPEMPQVTAFQQTQQALAMADPESFMQTELSVLQSRDLKRKVVRKLRLHENREFMTPAGPQGLDGQFAAIRARITRPLQGLFSAGRPAAPAPAVPPIVPPNPEQVETPAETRAIEALSAGLTVSLQQVSHLFTIVVSSSTPHMAALIANSIAKEYETQNLERRKANYQAQLTKIDEFVRNFSTDIDVARKNLIQQSSEANVLDPEMVNRNVNAAQSDLQNRITARQEAEAKLKEMKALDPDQDLVAALGHPDIQRVVGPLRTQLDTLRLDRRRFVSQGLGDNHPNVRAIDDQIQAVTNNLKDEIRRQIQAAEQLYRIAVTQEQTAQRFYETQNQLQLENTRNAIPYETLKQQILTNQNTLDTLQKQQKELEVLAQGVDNNVTIVEGAQPAQRPYKPNASRNILISLAVGLALAVMLAFGLDYLDDTIKTPEDVTRKLHIPFLGLVPSVRGDRQPVLSGPVPHDFGEAYRALRTSLVFTSGGETTRIITCTSAQPLEGKTTTACNLAMVLAFGGSRVLLIDADMRRPGVHKTLKMNNTVGLSHLLVGQARVREAIQRTSDPNFCVMTAGRTPPNPSELLASERMKQLIANLKQGPFDWVVIDTPPVLAVTDAVILTPLVDGVTFVLGAEMTRRRLAERAVQMLMVSRPKVVGGVLNRVNFDRNKYYYSRYYGYQYKSYYGTDSAPVATSIKG